MGPGRHVGALLRLLLNLFLQSLEVISAEFLCAKGTGAGPYNFIEKHNFMYHGCLYLTRSTECLVRNINGQRINSPLNIYPTTETKATRRATLAAKLTGPSLRTLLMYENSINGISGTRISRPNAGAWLTKCDLPTKTVELFTLATELLEEFCSAGDIVAMARVT